ncbi:MAG: hypothetical protein OXI48_08735 [bacterium]|nr:hypothetical protein [bacterium]
MGRTPAVAWGVIRRRTSGTPWRSARAPFTRTHTGTRLGRNVGGYTSTRLVTPPSVTSTSRCTVPSLGSAAGSTARRT